MTDQEEQDRYRAEHSAYRRQIHAEVLNHRVRIMKAAVRAVKTGSHGEDWMSATARLDGDPLAGDGIYGDLHVRNPTILPTITPPTTRHGRYLTGDVRESGPGSTIGMALCGLPFMADELWVTATHMLRSIASRMRRGDFYREPNLCGMCSYLSGQPTHDAAIVALDPPRKTSKETSGE